MNNELRENEFFCPRCQRKMNNSMRYCMGCGYINPVHPDNSNMVQYIDEKADYSNCILNQEQQQQLDNLGKIGVNKFNANVGIDEKVESFGLTNKNLFIFSMVSFFIVSAFVVFFYIYSFSSIGFSIDVGSLLSNYKLVLSIFFIAGLFSFVFYTDGLLRIKMGIPWWTMFIPVYGQMVFAEKIFGNILFGLLSFVPGVGTIYSLVLFFQMGNMFNSSGIGLLFLPFIFLPLIVYGDYKFNQITYYSWDTADMIKKEEFRSKSVFWMGIISIIGLVILNVFK